MRRTPLKRRTPMPRSQRPLQKIGRAAKRRAEKYSAHLKGAHFREIKRQVRERSGGRCERMVPPLFQQESGPRMNWRVTVRCEMRASVFNHTTYVRVPHELPEDVEHLCKFHEREYENARSYRAARRQMLARMQG